MSRVECQKRAKAGSAVREDNTQEASNSAVCEDNQTDNLAATGTQAKNAPMVVERESGSTVRR